MSALYELTGLLKTLKIPVETGKFSEKAPERYVVLTPLHDGLLLYADNQPELDVEEVRISLFSKGNYLNDKQLLTKALLDLDFVITDRRLLGLEENTGFYHYVLDVAKEYVRMED